jgi:hypothetical protein
MATSVPPCVRDDSDLGFARTFVAKIKNSQRAVEWAATIAGWEVLAVAVQRMSTVETGVVCIVVTVKAVRSKDYVHTLQRKLTSHPISADVEWVRPLDRHLQRLFGWGDVWANPEDASRPSSVPPPRWWQGAYTPEPFYVSNPPKPRMDLQVEWMRDELPLGASLVDFARACKRFLYNGVSSKPHFRRHCLELYRLYNPGFTARKECALLRTHGPEALETFQRVFDPSAPSRCRWCARAIEVVQGGPYELVCSNRCEEQAISPNPAEPPYKRRRRS